MAEVLQFEVADRTVRVTSPDRVCFPQRGYTKRDVVEYYLAVGDGIFRALRERPTTLQRFPEGIEGEMFFQKRAPTRGVPPWLETAQIAFPSGRKADELCPTDLAHVIWAAQMGTIVFHPWPVRRHHVDHPDELRIDLDPQPGTDFADAAEAAGVLHEVLDELGWTGWPKTSGGRGVHVYVRIKPEWDFIQARRAGIALAREVERRRPDLVTTAWWKEERGERVFVDFNQNAPHKTVIGAWTVRPRPGAQVSMPFAWDELDDIDPQALTLATVPSRVAEKGDAWESMPERPQSLEPLMEMHRRDMAAGLMDAPWPPVYPKMPNEPARVAPSRARKPDK